MTICWTKGTLSITSVMYVKLFSNRKVDRFPTNNFVKDLSTLSMQCSDARNSFEMTGKNIVGPF